MAPRRYLDVHILQTVPPANLNRDDQGNPKEAQFGGVRRSRVSSQAWKRATRLAFAETVPAADLGVRTKQITEGLSELLGERTSLAADARLRVARAVVAALGIKPGKKEDNTAYLLFYGRPQLRGLADLVAEQAGELSELADSALADAAKTLPVAETLRTGHPVDVALFGRMVADIPGLNVDGATQVAHAISTHAVQQEFDYYTAVDDENEREETGAGMIGSIGFNAATLYRYATVGLHQLEDNLADAEAARDATALFVRSFALSMPTGHRNSFAHGTLPHLVAVALRDDQPVNLASAFERPVSSSGGIAEASAVRLAKEFTQAKDVWGAKASHVAVSHGFTDRTAESVTSAFGAAVPFAELLSGLTSRIASDREQG
ncbi:CRISPR system Cascade subunit CasC [Actinoalloteichus hoggarensis]|uniref:CRISPR system Cascade subunit CasC n=1 Tax=Actinoalloteichus hoggarensis TaxID=1470176 RepID=A0A221W8J7_9PSEU|nr:type I-E CRISPR-associated protein Cas7/Cse4/CasC [Actinoalloteichus hoggarensis]ASO22340.1 CRISPR system Cascade subunit CasC [Actinoalloteichus hoggarensis]MBB5923240.1 CRISPR system Cascade subunit CasC [Actinoalloteichus hoggarensis]